MDGILTKNIKDIAHYQGPNEIPGIRFRSVREALGVSAWGMNVLELDPHCSGYPEHDHVEDGQEEVYLVLKGAIVLQVGGAETELSQGDLVRVAPAIRRKFVTRGEGATL